MREANCDTGKRALRRDQEAPTESFAVRGDVF